MRQRVLSVLVALVMVLVVGGGAVFARSLSEVEAEIAAVQDKIAAYEKEINAEKKQSIGDRLSEGVQQAAQYVANAPSKTAAKKSPGLGD